MKRALVVGGVALLVIALVVCAIRVASQGPDLKIGSNLKDPWEYFSAKVRARPDNRFRQTLCGRPLIHESQGMVVNYMTQFTYSPRHAIMLRTFSYQFDTNGTLMRVTSRWKFPILDF
jgi:hypothetical protein